MPVDIGLHGEWLSSELENGGMNEKRGTSPIIAFACCYDLLSIQGTGSKENEDMDTSFIGLEKYWGIWAVFLFCLVAITFMGVIQNRKIRDLRSKGLYPREKMETEEDVARLIKLGEMTLAVRCYRSLYGGSLKAAKQSVESIKAGLENA
jgi:hypothetical protein